LHHRLTIPPGLAALHTDQSSGSGLGVRPFVTARTWWCGRRSRRAWAPGQRRASGAERSSAHGRSWESSRAGSRR